MSRVGRTARAGRQGTAITILEQDQELNFERIIKEVGSTKVEQYQVDQDEFDEEKPRYSSNDRSCAVLTDESVLPLFGIL